MEIFMKFSKRYRPWIYIFVLAVAVVAVYKIIDHLDIFINFAGNVIKILNPFILGFVIAYLVNQPSNSIAGLCRKSKNKFLNKHADGLGVLAVYLIAVVVFVLIMQKIIPALYKNIVDLCNNLPTYANEGVKYLEDFQDNLGISLINTDSFSVENAIKYFVKEIDLNQFGKYAEGVINATSGLFNVFIAIIVSIYMCIDKKRIYRAMRRITSILFNQKHANGVFDYIEKINDIFSKYIYCKLLETLIITIISTIVLAILKIKYALFLGIMIGVMNLIPYFGSIISSVIAVIITIFSSGVFPAIWTGVALLVLEQVDGNFIGPKIIGDRLDMRPLWIIFSVTIGGGLFGVVGLLLSVPVMIVIKMIFTDILAAKEKQLKIEREEDKT